MVDFDPSPSSTVNMNGGAISDNYISKLDRNGNYVWAKSIAGTGSNWAGFQSIACDLAGSTYLTGNLDQTTDFNPGTGVFNLSPTGQSRDGFILKLNSNGAFVWVKQLNEVNGLLYEFVNSYKVIIDGYNNIYTIGCFSGTVDFDPGTSNFNLSSTGSFNEYDIFIQKLNNYCNLSGSSFSVSTCNSYVSPSGNYTWSTSGIFHDTLFNVSGCDSVLTINLNVESVITSVTQSGAILTANANSANYLWVDCDNGFAPVAPLTNNPTYIANLNGNYAVIVYQNGCSDTSFCYNVTNVNINEIGVSDFTLYPNPTINTLTIQFNTPITNGSIVLTNTMGQVVYTAVSNQKSIILNLKSLPAGLYFVHVITDKGSTIQKVVKQ